MIPQPPTPTFTGSFTFAGGRIDPSSILRTQPGDVIVFESPHTLTEAEMSKIRSGMKRLFPDTKLLILPKGNRISLVRQDELKTTS